MQDLWTSTACGRNQTGTSLQNEQPLLSSARGLKGEAGGFRKIYLGATTPRGGSVGMLPHVDFRIEQSGMASGPYFRVKATQC